MNCLLCNRTLNNTLTLAQLFSFTPYSQPLICQKCLQSFQKVEKERACPGCARIQANNQICPDCLKWSEIVPGDFVSHHAFYHYNTALKDWLHQYKIQGDTRLASLWKKDLYTYYQRHPSTLIVPIPISESSLQIRGFNQCIEMLNCANVPYVEVLGNIHHGQKQSKKNRYERLESAQPFQVIEKNLNLNQPILLFDDLYTTGRTLMHAKEVLYEAGVKSVHSLSIGR